MRRNKKILAMIYCIIETCFIIPYVFLIVTNDLRLISVLNQVMREGQLGVAYWLVRIMLGIMYAFPLAYSADCLLKRKEKMLSRTELIVFRCVCAVQVTILIVMIVFLIVTPYIKG